MTNAEAQSIAETTAKRVRRRHPYADFDALVQAGLIGVWNAEKTFVSARAALRTHAINCAKWAMLDYLREMEWIPNASKRIKNGKPFAMPAVTTTTDFSAMTFVEPERDELMELVSPHLTEREQLIVKMKYADNATWGSIGQVLGISAQGAQQHHSRILAALKKLFTGVST